MSNEHTLRAALEEIANLCEMSASTIRLHCGELTGNEVRCVQAVLGWIRRQILARAALAATAAPEQAQGKSCNELPPGNGYCHSCAIGDHANCRYIAQQAAPEQAEPVATLHDDGRYTWKAERKPEGYHSAGWRLDVYAAPTAQAPTEQAGPSLHGALMNMQPPIMGLNVYRNDASSRVAYVFGFNDARQAAAELVLAAPTAQAIPLIPEAQNDCAHKWTPLVERSGHYAITMCNLCRSAKYEQSEEQPPIPAAPAIPAGFALIPTDNKSVSNMGWAYLNAAREAVPEHDWVFSPVGFLAAIAAATAAPDQPTSEYSHLSSEYSEQAAHEQRFHFNDHQLESAIRIYEDSKDKDMPLIGMNAAYLCLKNSAPPVAQQEDAKDAEKIYRALKPIAQHRTSLENVQDVLSAIAATRKESK